MGSTVMMYVLPMLLGQSYDLGKERTGLQVFSSNAVDNATVIEQYFTDSQYRLIDDSSEVKDFLDISGKLSLKIKGGMVDVSGEGSYLKDFSTKANTLQILIKVHFETVTKTLPTSINPLPNWYQLNEKYLGTHYCRSITYGGDLIVSVSISAANHYDMERIKAAINGQITASGGSFEAQVKARLEKLRSDAQDSNSMEINYYASVPIRGLSYTVEGLLELVKDFPNQVKKVNNGLGNPLRMELYPLKALDRTYKDYLENRALGETLDDIDYQFDDLRATRKVIAVWSSGLSPMIPEKVQKRIETFTSKINVIYGVFLKTIDDLDVTKGASTQPLDDAIKAYEDGDYAMPQKYSRKLLSLQQEIYKENPELKPRIGGAQYSHWGRSDCEGTGTETVTSGVVTASETGQHGGSSDFLCSPVNPAEPDVKEYLPSYDPEEDDNDNVLVSPLKYVGELQKFKEMTLKNIACATCRTPMRTTILMKPGDKNCPTDKWIKEYEGILMAPGMKAPKGEYICVDKNMQPPKGSITFGTTDDDSHLSEIQEVSVECGALPCGPYEAAKVIPCVVCTI